MLTMEMTIPYTGEPLEGLQIMGVLETRALDFDNIIITDFNDDIYPGRSRGNSFIPYTLRRGFDLPTVERQDAIFSYNFYRMLSHAKNIWFIANTHADDQHSGELSRYYYQLLWQYQVPIKQITINDKLITTIAEKEAIEKTEEVQQLLSKYFASTPEYGRLSASALNDYIRCQKSFYYKYRRRRI
jgi:inactivated superfamily I helicase